MAWGATAELCEWAMCAVDGVTRVLDAQTKSKAAAVLSFGLSEFVRAMFAQVCWLCTWAPVVQEVKASTCACACL
jgi:hypothetical protein